MADPFEGLREPPRPIAPDPLFAAHLRARLARALELPKGVTVSQLTIEADPEADPEAEARTEVASSGPAVIPYLIVADARRALDWYADAMGAHRRGEPLVMADGRIGHSELDFGGGIVFLADESPESGVAAPRPGDGATVSLLISVANVDRLAARAVQAGAELERAPADYPHGRNAVIRDPFGHRWIVSAEAEAEAEAEAAMPAPARPSDIIYVSLWVPDVERAAAFFGDVLGWTYRPGSGEYGRQVEGQSRPHGLFGGQEPSTLFLCFGVVDLDRAVARVRGAGGQAGEPTMEPYGRTADCVDNQGVRFAMVEVPRIEPSQPRWENGQRHGDVAYVTMEVVDSARARAFYGSVLQWDFRPGRVDDGWSVVDTVPMTGMHGGMARATTVPMYRVDDIAAAVARVRARRGTASDPEPQGYGITSDCADDQGTRFYLGQL